MSDVILLAAMQACEKFGSADKFNGACFSYCLSRIAGSDGTIDGRVVRAILCGRSDIEILEGGSHFRLLAGKEKP
jgi:hypothetical protein